MLTSDCFLLVRDRSLIMGSGSACQFFLNCFLVINYGKGGYNKIRSPARAETDWVFCPEVPESPRP